MFKIGTEECEYFEAALLFQGLMKDPSSCLGAALHKLDYPISHELIVLFNLYDLTLRANVKKNDFKPHPRPWKDLGNSKRIGKLALPMDEAEAIWATMPVLPPGSVVPKKLSLVKEAPPKKLSLVKEAEKP